MECDNLITVNARKNLPSAATGRNVALLAFTPKATALPVDSLTKKPMTNPRCEYDNDGTRITAPGKFEGEPVFAPYFWGLGLEGFADDDSGFVYRFKFKFGGHQGPGPDSKCAFSKELKAWLGRKRTLKLREDSQGFVHCF